MRATVALCILCAGIYSGIIYKMHGLLAASKSDTAVGTVGLANQPMVLTVVRSFDANGGWHMVTIAWSNQPGVYNDILLWGTNAGQYDNAVYCKTNSASVNVENGRLYYFQALGAVQTPSGMMLISGESKRIYYQVPGTPRPIQQPK